MNHILFQQLILCIFYGVIPWLLISWYISKNQKELEKASNDLYIASNDLKNAIINGFGKSKTFYIIMLVALIVILVCPFK